MKIYCPHCGVKGSADDSYSGRKIKCPQCQEMFELKPDMAIDQDEFLTADLGAETVTETPVQDPAQQEGPVPEVVDPAVEASLPGSDEEPFEDMLALDDLIEEEGKTPVSVDEPEAEEQLDDAIDDLDWGSFEADLDKEIAASEQAQSMASEEIADPSEDEGPIAALGADDLSIAEDELEVIEEATSIDDFDGVLGTLGKDEEGQTEDSLDVVADFQEELTGIDEVEEVDEIDEVVVTVEEIEEDSSLDTLTAPGIEMPLLEEDDTTDSEEDVSEPEELEEVMSFADADLPEVEEEDEADFLIDDIDDVEEEEAPYGIAKEQCWQCGKQDSVGEPFVAIDGRLYCTECSPGEEPDELAEAFVALEAQLHAEDISEAEMGIDEDIAPLKPKFTVGGVLKEAWGKLKGIKGSVWAASAVMYLLLIVLVAGGSLLLPSSEIGADSLISFIPSALFQFVFQALYIIFLGGLLFMGIRHVAGDEVSWKMIFHGFSFTGKIVVVTILKVILITIGYILLILPGIYLTIGYTMTIPLIVDKNLSPWQALETSRKAVHKVWWRVAGIFFVTCLLVTVASIPLGIGLIWVWPLALVIPGVVYHRLFGR